MRLDISFTAAGFELLPNTVVHHVIISQPGLYEKIEQALKLSPNGNEATAADYSDRKSVV